MKGDGVFVAGVGGEQVDVEGSWRTGTDGGAEEGRASQEWEPTSPWSKDGPPVPLKNTCEFD